MMEFERYNDLQDDNSLYVSVPDTSEEESTSMKNHIIYLRTQLMQLIESKESKPNCDETLRILLLVDVPLQNKCHSLLINDLLSKNGTERESLGKLSSAFNILYRYGRNLLKDVTERPQFWKVVKFSNSVFHEKVDSLVGGRHILCQLGYTQEVNGGLAFPDHTEPHRDTVVELSADLLIGKYELDTYAKGQHPFPCYIEAHISMTARVPQGLANTSQQAMPTRPTSTVSDVIFNDQPMSVRQLPPGGVPLVGMAPGVGQHLLKKTSPPRQPPLPVAAEVLRIVPTTSQPAPRLTGQRIAQSQELCRVCETFPTSVLCNCWLCDNLPYCQQCCKYWHESPQMPQAPSDKGQHGKAIHVSSCQMCGKKPDIFKYCQTCNKTHCKGCDRSWHNHPNRQNHGLRDIQASRQTGGSVSSSGQVQESESQGQTHRVLEHHKKPSASQISVKDLIEQKEMATSARAAFPHEGVDTQHGGLESKAGAKYYENVQLWTPQLIQQFHISPSDTSGPHVNSPKTVSGEKAVVVIPKKEVGSAPSLGPSSIQEESMYASMLVDEPPPPVPPKPLHGKPEKPTSRILESLLKNDPAIRQVMLDMELKKLETEIKALNKGIEIYKTTKKDPENPECKRMETQLEEKLEVFCDLCEYREKFGMGKYSSDIVIESNLRGVTNKKLVENTYQNVLPKQAWADKDIPPLRPKSVVNSPVPSQIHFQGVQSGESRDDNIFQDVLRPPGIIPLDSLGSFQPVLVQNVPKPDYFRKRVPEKPQSKWECQFCTFHNVNEPGNSQCLMCEKENINPKSVDSDQDVKAASEKLKVMAIGNRPLAKAFEVPSMKELTLEEKDFKNKFASQTLGRTFAKHEEEKKLHTQQKAEGLAMVKNLRSFEGGEYDIDQFEIAANHSDDWQLTPFEWLQQYWDTFKENVIAQANHHGAGDNPNVLSNLTMREMESALMECKHVDTAIEKCQKTRKEMVDRLKEVTDVPVEDIIKLVGECNGNEYEVITKLNEAVIEMTLAAVWNEEEAEIAIRQEEFREFIQNDNNDKERRVRALLVQGRLNTWEAAEVILDVLQDRALDLAESTLEDIVDAARNANGDLERCKSYLQQDCTMCFCKFPMNKIRNLIHCQCKICEGCLTENFQYAARDREARHMACPVCGEPDLQNTNTDTKADTHFQILDLILKNLLDDATYQLFQKKLRDRHLMQEPNFRWCAHCECGIIFNNEEGQLKMTCPECHQATCFNCKDKWEPQHEDLTCEQFTQWKYDNDPERQTAGLARHLQENGIDCPNCKYRYALARGGCMHFICIQCGWEFCSGCNNVFKKGDSCGLLRRCANSGLHCHHPRNCLYYLRDNDVQKLKKLLESNDISFMTDVTPEDEEAGEEEEEEEEKEEEEKKCSVMEQKETPNGLKDERCGNSTKRHEAGLCEVHYKEYLVMLINRHGIDPVAIMEEGDLKCQLERLEKTVPGKKKKESGGQYKKRLQEYIKANVPLTTDNTRRGLRV
ncbi:E3 ubiquitin-protein ligase RNF31-like isoform X2 [Lineus longissimus]|uniref:E3 ubiquitin-protein ligase RNF31-like isoform X2 n=1 Tax=Lineus longissimus TaxID=88925 RepID=UPI002B4C8165